MARRVEHGGFHHDILPTDGSRLSYGARATGAGTARADQFLGSYEARISDNDHQASDGYALDSAAQMVRQDRANWHKFGPATPRTRTIRGSAPTAARARIEKLLNRAAR